MESISLSLVLLDAGAGKTWSFLDPETEENIEEVKVSFRSYHMFVQEGSLLIWINAHAENWALTKVMNNIFKFQRHKLEGVDGRVGLLNSLGTCILNNKNSSQHQTWCLS